MVYVVVLFGGRGTGGFGRYDGKGRKKRLEIRD